MKIAEKKLNDNQYKMDEIEQAVIRMQNWVSQGIAGVT